MVNKSAGRLKQLPNAFHPNAPILLSALIVAVMTFIVHALVQFFMLFAVEHGPLMRTLHDVVWFCVSLPLYPLFSASSTVPSEEYPGLFILNSFCWSLVAGYVYYKGATLKSPLNVKRLWWLALSLFIVLVQTCLINYAFNRGWTTGDDVGRRKGNAYINLLRSEDIRVESWVISDIRRHNYRQALDTLDMKTRMDLVDLIAYTKSNEYQMADADILTNTDHEFSTQERWSIFSRQYFDGNVAQFQSFWAKEAKRVSKSELAPETDAAIIGGTIGGVDLIRSQHLWMDEVRRHKTVAPTPIPNQ